MMTRPEQWNRISRGMRWDFAPEIGESPDLIAIAHAHLRAAEPDYPHSSWLDSSRIARLFEKARPIDSVEIADLILGEQRKVGPGGREGLPSEEGVNNVVKARSNWREELREWHSRDGRTAIQRNFLLAAAILRDAPVGHIYAKAADLCRSFSDAEMELSGQTAPGVIELLHSVEGELDELERVEFRRPHWEDATVEYFWADRPLSRQIFMKWLADSALSSKQGDLVKLNQDDSLQVGRRVVEFALKFAVRHERPLPLAALVDTWHENRVLWRLLVDSVDAAATSDVNSQYVRRVLLDWAKAAEVARKRLVAAVCARNFGAVHTGFALRRLRHIGDSCTIEILPDLQNAVRRLWLDEAARVTLLQYLGAWCRNDYAAGRVVFETLAVIGDSETRLPHVLAVFSNESFRGVSIDVLEIAWRQVLDYSDLMQTDSPAQKCVNAWMSAVIESGRADAVLSVLAAAVSGATGTKASVRRDVLRGCVQKWVEGGVNDFDKRRMIQRNLSELLDADIARSARRIVAQG